MNWLKMQLIVVLTMSLLWLAVNIAWANRFVWFELCKHKTGETLGPTELHGFQTHGRAMVNTSSVHAIVPLYNNNCVLVEFSNNKSVTVVGSFKEVYCKLRGGPVCEPK